MYKIPPPAASQLPRNSTTATQPRSSLFSMPEIVSRLWSKISTIKDEDLGLQDCQEKNPDATDTRAPLKNAPLPLVLEDSQYIIEQLGWSVATFPTANVATSPYPQSSTSKATTRSTTRQAPPPPPGLHPLQQAAQDLFIASKAFFALPEAEKAKYAKPCQGSEEGWSAIPGEKEMLALRTLEGTPPILKQAAQRYWSFMAAYLDSFLGRLSTRLDLPDDPNKGLRRYVGRCRYMAKSEAEKDCAMLRLFRYEGDEAKVVAEPHADLGLLSAVIGSKPGLEVWGGETFLPVETHFASSLSNFTITVGRQLEALSNRRFPAGGHRVVSYGQPKRSSRLKASNRDANDMNDGYRYSIVFVLRGAQDVDVDTDLLTTAVTGPFDMQVRNIKMGEWYKRIRGAHFNINAGTEERETQRKKVESLLGKDEKVKQEKQEKQPKQGNQSKQRSRSSRRRLVGRTVGRALRRLGRRRRGG